MRVLAISDVITESLLSPAVRELAHGVECVFSCGDLPSDYLEYIVSLLDVPLYYVMGNHGARGGERMYPEGCVNLDGRVVEHQEFSFAGLEGSPRYNNVRRFQYTENGMSWKIARLAPKLWSNRLRRGRFLDVLLTHAPPFGIHDGSDVAHRGFKSLRAFVDRYQPNYLIHGHQHIYDSRTTRETLRGHTLIINAYGYRFINLVR